MPHRSGGGNEIIRNVPEYYGTDAEFWDDWMILVL
jgi:hypothetical protein